MAGPFKMKGPSLYNSPVKKDKKSVKEIKGTSIFGNTPKEFVRKAAKPYTELYKLVGNTAKTFLVDGPKDAFNLGKKK